MIRKQLSPSPLSSSGLEGLDLGEGIQFSKDRVITPPPTPTPTPVPPPAVEPIKAEEPIKTELNKDKPELTPELNKDKPTVFSDDQKLSFLNETFKGQYTKVDEIVNEFTNLRTKVQTLDQREKELQDLAKKVKDPLAEHPELAKARSFLKATEGKYDLETYFKIAKLDLKSVNHFDLLVDDFMKRNPDEDINDVRDMLEDKYKITLNAFNLDQEDENYDTKLIEAEKQIKRNKLLMRNDAEPIIERFRDLQSKITEPDYEVELNKAQEEAEAKKAENKSKWTGVLPKLADGFTEFKAFKPGEKEPYMTMEVSKEQQGEIATLLTQYLENRGWDKVDVTQENAVELGNVMYRMYSDLYSYEISNAYAQKRVTENDQLWAERTGIDPNKFKPDYVPDLSNVDNKSKAEKHNEENNEKVLTMMREGKI